MGHFDAHREINVKMTKCRRNVHTPAREVVARYPHGHASKLATVAAPHLAQRGTSLASDTARMCLVS